MVLVASAAVLITGDIQGKIMTEVQPMKMAAAEALYTTESPASFSVLTIGTLDGSREVFAIKIPYLLSFLGTGDPNGTVHGINDLQAQYATQYGPGNYTPIIPVTYWTFRLMIAFGMAAAAVALLVLWSQRKGRTPSSKWLLAPGWPCRCCRCWPTPSAGSSPRWAASRGSSSAVLTRNGVSRGVSLAEVLTSFTAFTLIYATLAVVEVKLLLRYAKAGVPDVSEQPPIDDTDDAERRSPSPTDPGARSWN